jgi:hypothetical protein
MRNAWVAFVYLLLATALSPLGAGASMLDTLAGSTPEQRAGIQNRFMEAKLGLTADQTPKIEALNLEFAKKMQPILDGDEGAIAKMRAVKELNEQKDAALQAVLTPDQFQSYVAAKDELRDKLEAEIAQKRGATP